MEDGEWRQLEVWGEPQLLLILSSSDLLVRVLVKCGVGVGLPKATLRMADAVGRKSCGGREMLGRGRPGQAEREKTREARGKLRNFSASLVEMRSTAARIAH